jgi:hypothetical protein
VAKREKIILVISALLVAGAMIRLAIPKWPEGPSASVEASDAPEAAPQKTTGPPAAAPNSNSDVFADAYTKRLLLLMDTDKNGKVSKQEFMNFMEKEFDRLDVNHDGELDVKELAKIQVRPYVGK